MAKPPSETAQLLLELLEPLGDVTSRRMFGAEGVMFAGGMFALVHDETVYFRVGGRNAARYDELELPQFSYTKAADGMVVRLPYREVPADVLEDSETACAWAIDAIASRD